MLRIHIWNHTLKINAVVYHLLLLGLHGCAYSKFNGSSYTINLRCTLASLSYFHACTNIAILYLLKKLALCFKVQQTTTLSMLTLHKITVWVWSVLAGCWLDYSYETDVEHEHRSTQYGYTHVATTPVLYKLTTTMQECSHQLVLLYNSTHQYMYNSITKEWKFR